MTRPIRYIGALFGSIAAVLILSVAAMASDRAVDFSRAVLYEQMFVDKSPDFSALQRTIDLAAATDQRVEFVAHEKFTNPLLQKRRHAEPLRMKGVNQYLDISVPWPAKRDRWRTRTL